jgi:O-antigen/teichoic acid export membrane protein
MAATVLTSALGMAYWAAAARLYDTETVGRASAVVSAMLLVCNASQLNLSVGLMRFLPVSRGHERRLVVTAYAVAACAGFLIAGVFLLVAPQVSKELRFLSDSGFLSLLFVFGVVIWVVFALQDAVLTGIRATLWVPVENVVFGLFKLALLVAFVGAATSGILGSWVLSMIVMLVPVNWLIFRRLLPRKRPPTDELDEMPAPRTMAKFVGGDYIGTLLSHASTTALPLLVIAMAGAAENAVFYIAWTLSYALDFIATGTASSFLVEGAARQDAVDGFRKAAARRATLLLVPVVIGVSVFADPLLSIFGPEYRGARWAVVLLCVAALPRLFLLLRLADFRVQRRVATVVKLQALSCVMMLGLSAVVLHFGAGSEGVAASWLATEIVVLAAALLASRRHESLSRVLATGPSAPPLAAETATAYRAGTHD